MGAAHRAAPRVPLVRGDAAADAGRCQEQVREPLGVRGVARARGPGRRRCRRPREPRRPPRASRARPPRRRRGTRDARPAASPRRGVAAPRRVRANRPPSTNGKADRRLRRLLGRAHDHLEGRGVALRLERPQAFRQQRAHAVGSDQNGDFGPHAPDDMRASPSAGPGMRAPRGLARAASYKLDPSEEPLDLNRDQKLDLYRFMRLNRVVEERLVNLYRQGKVVGGLYRSLGQEATSVGSAYALRKGDIVGPLIRNLGRRPRDGLLPARRDDPVHGTGDFALRRQGLQSPLRQARAGRHLSDLDARGPRAGDGRDRARGPDAEEGPRHDDVDRRRRHLDRRLPRGHQLRRGPEAPPRRHRREQRMGVLDTLPQADGGEDPRRQGRGVRDPRRARRRQRRPRGPRRRAPRGRLRARGRRAHPHRGGHLSHEGARRARRAGLRAEGRARGPGAPRIRSSGTRGRSSPRAPPRPTSSRRSTRPSARRSIARSSSRRRALSHPRNSRSKGSTRVSRRRVLRPRRRPPSPGGAPERRPRTSEAPTTGAPARGQTTYVDAIREGLREEMARDEQRLPHRRGHRRLRRRVQGDRRPHGRSSAKTASSTRRSPKPRSSAPPSARP